MRLAAFLFPTMLFLTAHGQTARAADPQKQLIAELRRRDVWINRDEPAHQSIPIAIANVGKDDHLRRAARLPSIRKIDLRRSGVTDTGLAELTRFPDLEELDLSECRKITDSGIEHVGRCLKLKRLKLNRLKVSNDIVRHLSQLLQLESLEISATPRLDGTLRVNDADVASLAGLVRLQHLNLAYSRVSDTGLAQLKGLDRLEELDLTETRVTLKSDVPWSSFSRLKSLKLARNEIDGDALRLLTQFANLEDLDLSSTLVDDAGVARLADLHQLRTLRLAETPTSGTALASLEKLTALETIDLSGTTFSDDFLSYLRPMQSLRIIQLNRTPVAGWLSLVHLGTLEHLQTLELAETQVTDSSLEHLPSVHRLQHLDLSGTALSDAGVTHILKLRTLKSVELERTNVTKSGRQKLRKQWPGIHFRTRGDRLTAEAPP